MRVNRVQREQGKGKDPIPGTDLVFGHRHEDYDRLHAISVEDELDADLVAIVGDGDHEDLPIVLQIQLIRDITRVFERLGDILEGLRKP